MYVRGAPFQMFTYSYKSVVTSFGRHLTSQGVITCYLEPKQLIVLLQGLFTSAHENNASSLKNNKTNNNNIAKGIRDIRNRGYRCESV